VTPAALIIMDGFGLAAPSYTNAVYMANTPVLDRLRAENPHSTLKASGEDVGLPEGQIGNSEVGHTNIGAGRVVYQSLPRISRDIKSGVFFENPALIGACEHAKQHNTALHIMGLVSDGGVHSHIDHIIALLDLAKRHGLKRVFVHAFTDGRDVPPASGEGYIERLEKECRQRGYSVATVSGRFYAMDRDNRWERVELAYNAIVCGQGERYSTAAGAVRASYGGGVTDEFVKPCVINPLGMIRENDAVIFANFRPDRARELTRTLCDPYFNKFERKKGFFPLCIVTMEQYDDTLPNVTAAYAPHHLENTIGEVISKAGLNQIRAAETEKYAHVTFFLNGGREEKFDGEFRILVPSPKEYATYDLIPEMSATRVAEETAAAIRTGQFAFTCVNFANCDMVGHTGVLTAAIKAAETVDAAVGIIAQAVSEIGGVTIITADHGNAEEMEDEHGQPMTAHTTNLVPFIVAGDPHPLKSGKLADIAPTILAIMGIAKPDEMTGHDLRVL